MSKISLNFQLFLLIIVANQVNSLELNNNEKENTLKFDDDDDDKPVFEGIYITHNCENKENGYKGELVYQGPMETYMTKKNKIVKNLYFYIQLNSNNELSFKIYPTEEPFFEMPHEKPFPYEKNTKKTLPENPVY